MKEVFKFPTWTFWLLGGILFIQDILWYFNTFQKVGYDIDNSNTTSLLISNGVILLVSLWLFFSRLIVNYGEESIHIQFKLIPFGNRVVNYNDISSFAIKEKGWLSYGGYGIRWSSNYTAFVADSPSVVIGEFKTKNKSQLIWSVRDTFNVSRLLNKKIKGHGE